MAKYFTKATRDFTRTVNLGPLTTITLGTGVVTVVAPAKTIVMSTKAGDVQTFTSAKRRDAYIAAIDAQNPGAVVAVNS